MKSRFTLSAKLFAIALGAGLFIGLFARIFHSYHHNLTVFYSPDRMEAYIDGQCLNIAHPLPVSNPDIDLFFEQMLQRPHKAQYLQYFQNVIIRDYDSHEIIWEYSPEAKPPWAPEKIWGQRFLELTHLENTGGFGHFHPIHLEHNRIGKESFVLNIQSVMPTSLRLHFVDTINKTRNIFGADFFAGTYAFALNGTWEWTQKYFINDAMHLQLKTAFLFRLLSGVGIAFVFCLICLLISWLVSLIPETGMKIRKAWSSPLQKVPLYCIIPAILAALGAWLVSHELFQHIPRVNDEGVYMFQARVFASGHFTANPPVPVDAFKHLGIWWKDRVFSYYTYGHSLLLALGFLTRTIKLLPTVFTAITVLLTCITGARIYHSRWTGFIAGILLSASPLFMILGGSYMSHTSATAASMVFLFFLHSLLKTSKRSHAVLAGLGLGVAFTIRPVTAVVFGFLPVTWAVFRLIFRKSYILPLILILTFAFMVSTTFIHAYLTTGNWSLIQHQVEDRFEKGNDTATFWKYLVQNFTWFQNRAFGWIPTFSLMFLSLSFILLTRNPWNWIFLSGFIINAFLYSKLAHFGWTHEPRYWSEFMPLIALLSANGIQSLGEFNRKLTRSERAKTATWIVGLLVITVLTIISIQCYWPFEIQSYTNYCGVQDSTVEKVRSVEEPGSIILLKGHPDFIFIPYFYMNDVPYFDGDIIYAMGNDQALNEELMEKYPDRKVYIIEDRKDVKRIR